MPGLDGTGPRGTGQVAGRGFGRCRFGPVNPEVIPSPAQALEGAGQPGETTERIFPQEPLSGAGRGGIPYGCERGHAFGGGRHCRRG